MDKKICVITGANSGIGKAAAVQIALEGYFVIMTARSKERGEKALKEVRTLSKSDSVELMILDLSLKSSIKHFAETYRKKYDRLDVLIHNAAAFDVSQKEVKTTEEGIESIWATNHLGPVYLTELLMESLKQSKQGRIITVASKGLVLHPNLKVDLKDPEFKNGKFSVSKAYYQSKLAQVMYTYWIAEELKNTNITINCIRVTNVKIDLNRYPNLSALAKFAYSIKSKKSITPEAMAKTYTYLAVSETVRDITGKYFDENNQLVQSSKYSYDKDEIKRVKQLTETYF
ncbi:MAG: dehydrogenase [Anaerolineaceae bacterium]|nr:dehydrogenase [Anaerolineaceae bacterium]